MSPKLASPKLSLAPQEEEVLPGASGLLGDAALMAKLEDVAMVQVSHTCAQVTHKEMRQFLQRPRDVHTLMLFETTAHAKRGKLTSTACWSKEHQDQAFERVGVEGWPSQVMFHACQSLIVLIQNVNVNKEEHRKL